MSMRGSSRLQRENSEDSRNSWNNGASGIAYSEIKIWLSRFLKTFSCGQTEEKKSSTIREVSSFALHSGVVLMYFSTWEAEATQQKKGPVDLSHQRICVCPGRGAVGLCQTPTLENQAVPGIPLDCEELINNVHCKSARSCVLWQQCLSTYSPEGAGDLNIVFHLFHK